LLVDEFVLGTTTVLGTPKRIGDIIAGIEGITGVSYSHVELLIYRAMSVVTGNNYTVTAPLLPVKPQTVEIYATITGVDTKVAYDDGVGALVAMAGYVVSGTVAYDTGVVDVLCSTPDPGVEDVVSIRYAQDESGDIVVGQDQAAKYRSTNITSITYEA
jgi:hypothetical protein